MVTIIEAKDTKCCRGSRGLDLTGHAPTLGLQVPMTGKVPCDRPAWDEAPSELAGLLGRSLQALTNLSRVCLS